MSSRVVRTGKSVALLLCFCFSLATILHLVVRGLDRADVAEPMIALDALAGLEPALQQLKANRSTPRIAFLGDSTVVSYPVEHQLPGRLQGELRRKMHGRRPIRVYSLAAVGLTPFDYYFLADSVVDASPDQVVMSFNLAAFSEPWSRRFPRLEFAGWIAPSELPRALMLPLEAIGLSADRLFLHQLLVRVPGLDPWRRFRMQQTRVETGRLQLEAWASSVLKPNPVLAFRRRYWIDAGRRIQIPKQKRYNEAGMRMHHGDAFAGQDASSPVIRVFAESLRIFADAGIPVLVYIVPINWEHSQKLGVYDEAGLRLTLDTIAQTAERYGAVVLDLHRLFPDRGFVDAPGHFTHEGEIDGPREVARALADAIVARAPRLGGKAR